MTGRSRDGDLLEVRRLEVSIILPSHLGPFIEELAFQVVARAWSPKLFAAQAGGESLVALVKGE